MVAGALAGVRIIECGDFTAAPYAAVTLGHLGADVVKIEPPAGDSARHRGPFPDSSADGERSGLHLFINQAKRSVVLDLDTDAGRAELRRLAGAADALIASGPADLLHRRGLTYDDLAEANPALVVTTITPQGIDVPSDGLPMRELCDLALSGWLSISPGALDQPELPPLKPWGQQAHFQAGIHAAIATLGALAAHDRDGLGQHVDVSVQAVIASQMEIGLMHYLYGGRVASRLGIRILGPWGTVQLADGLLFIVCVTEEEWRRLVSFLGTPEWAASPLFADRLLRAENNDALLALIEDGLAGGRVQATYDALQAQRIPCAPVNDMGQLLQNPHLQAREAFVAVDSPGSGLLSFPGAPWKLSATPWQTVRPAPALDAHGDEVRREWLTVPPKAPVPATASTRPRLPLEGVTVADFTWVWAGPVATMQLAHLGANVIKVETRLRPDTVRAIPPFWEEIRGPNRSGYFNEYNQGKRSITLNLKHPRGLALAQELARRADVVADNFSAGVMTRLGLGYEQLTVTNPSLVQVSLSGHGQTGPAAAYVAYGPAQVPMMGLASLTGYPGGGPREVGISYGDPNAGLHAACAVLAALSHRRRTGEGQYIDMSQWEAAIPLVAEGLLTYQIRGSQPPRMGNRDEFQAPQGVFRCLGDDTWVAISCWSDEEWQSLTGAIGRPDLGTDTRLASAAGRKSHEEAIERAIGDWTATRTREDAAAALSAAGVPAVAVLTTAEVCADPVLAERGLWVQLPHPEVNGARHVGIPWRFSGTPLQVRSASPTVGQHTDEVLGDVLGLAREEIEQLHADGALE